VIKEMFTRRMNIRKLLKEDSPKGPSMTEVSYSLEGLSRSKL